MSPISANQLKKEIKRPTKKRLKAQTHEASNLWATRPHSLAMPTMNPSAEPQVPDKIPSQESPLSPEWTHAITILMGHPLSSEPGNHIKKWIIYLRIHKYTMFALKWDPTQFKLNINLKTYQETDGSLAYLKGPTVRKLVSLMKYMSLLISRPNAQKHNLLYFISVTNVRELNLDMSFPIFEW